MGLLAHVLYLGFWKGIVFSAVLASFIIPTVQLGLKSWYNSMNLIYPSLQRTTTLVLFTSRLGSWHPGLEARAEPRPRLEPPRNHQEPPRGSSLEFESACGPLSGPLESPRGSSRLVDPCSSRQELGAKRLESARLVHNTKQHPQAIFFLCVYRNPPRLSYTQAITLGSLYSPLIPPMYCTTPTPNTLSFPYPSEPHSVRQKT